MPKFANVVILMVLICAVTSSYSATILVPSQQPTIQAGINAAVNENIDSLLLAYWSFDDSTAFDSSENGHHATVVGPVPVAGHRGVAFEFDGQNDYIEVADANEFDGLARMTLVFWARLASFGGLSCGTECMPLMAKWHSGDLSDNSFLLLEQGGVFRFGCRNSLGVESNSYAAHNLPLNQWFHFAVVFNEGLVTVYIDGETVGSELVSVQQIAEGNHPFLLGAICNDLGYRHFSGALDEVRVYSRALDSQVVSALYHLEDTRVHSLDISGNAIENVISHSPVFCWNLSPNYFGQDSVQIQVDSDSNWIEPSVWNPAPFASTDTFVVYDGSALVDGQTYYLRLRVHNSLAWSDWYQTSFRMNSVPSAPTLRTPIDLAVVGLTPILWVTNGTDAETDPLTYEFAGFHDTDCVAGADINLLGVAQTADSTGGQIVDPLVENCRYFWRARAYDGFEYSAWTPLAQFMVNGAPEAPTAPSLDSPPLPDNKPVFTLLPTLSWLPSYDPDPADTVRYKLELSDRANFSFALVRDSLLQTNLPLTDSLEFGTHYYWRVTARDKTNLTAVSSVKEFWTWRLGDLNHSHSTDLSDLSLLIAYLVQTPRPVILPKMVADLTGDCGVDLSDLSTMIAYMTTTGIVLHPGCE